MTTPYFQSVLSAFSQMNTNQLHLLLMDDGLYEDTTKDIFLGEIQLIFDAHKHSGDTELVYYHGQCGSTECTNCGMKGYRFVGNHSKNYFDLLFLIEGDKIKEIFCCSEFKTDQGCDELGQKATIYINRDDQVGFVKTPRYWHNLNLAMQALSEIKTTPLRLISLDEVEYWLDRYKDVYDAVGGYDFFMPTMKWTPFTELYSELKEIADFVSANRSEILSAAEGMELIHDEETLIAWLCKYDTFFRSIPIGVTLSWAFRKDEAEMLEHSPVLFADSDIIRLRKIIAYQDAQNDLMLRKYGIYTMEEQIEIINGPEYYKDDFLSSLQFHLTKREEAREMGVKLPLYVNSDHSGQEQ
jgi:hypothetical protein